MSAFIKLFMAMVLCAFAVPTLGQTPDQQSALDTKMHAIYQMDRLTKQEKKLLDDIVFVVFCEDNTSLVAARLVLSTVYNRAQKHDLAAMQAEVSKKRQYSCYRMKRIPKKLDNQRYRDIEAMIKRFIFNEEPPLTTAKYFYNHKLVPRSALGKMRLKVVQVHGSHTYLDHV